MIGTSFYIHAFPYSAAIIGNQMHFYFVDCRMVSPPSDVEDTSVLLRKLMMSLIGLFSSLQLSTISSSCKRLFHTCPRLSFQVSAALNAEPLKKKKKMDPALIKMREDRKKRRIEKSIRRLEKSEKQLKPIDEMEVHPKLLKEIKLRTRNLKPLSQEIIDERISLKKEWCDYKYQQHLAEMQMVDRLISAQRKALDELRLESEELYQEAIQIDLTLIPFSTKGPVDSPPIKDYDSPDGEYKDVSRKWE